MRIHPIVWIASGLVVAGISYNLAGSFWIFTILGIIFFLWGVFQMIMSRRHRAVHHNVHPHRQVNSHLQHNSPVPQQRYAPVMCPSCHGPLHSNHNFCPRCGKRVR